jgi:hypothetical protein
MLLSEIMNAVDNSKRVYWQCSSYEVIRGGSDSGYFIRSLSTGHCIRLVQSDGKTLNGDEADFYVDSVMNDAG